MLIDRNTPVVASLLSRWKNMPATKENQESFKGLLAQTIIEPRLRHATGQLMLFYHQFLTVKPGGNHSFAHGSELISQDVYWVTAGRIKSDRSLSLITTSSMRTGIAFPSESTPETRGVLPGNKYLVPLQWSESLQVCYRFGILRPSFDIREKILTEQSMKNKNDTPAPSADISAFGENLFRLTRGRFDWATNIYLVIGTVAVKKWLAEHKSLPTFERLMQLQS